ICIYRYGLAPNPTAPDEWCNAEDLQEVSAFIRKRIEGAVAIDSSKIGSTHIGTRPANDGLSVAQCTALSHVNRPKPLHWYPVRRELPLAHIEQLKLTRRKAGQRAAEGVLRMNSVRH